MRQYVLSVICAAFICGTVLSFLREGISREVVKLLCGAFLAVTVISPVADIDLGRGLSFPLPDSLDAQALAAEGEAQARTSRAAIIKQSCETYIMDKATGLAGDFQAEISVSEEGIPVAAELGGKVSAHVKGQIQRILEEDLGIPKENLRWTG